MSDIFKTCLEAANEGGKIIAHYYDKGVEIRSKETYNLVSDADIDSEKKIISIIKDKFPDHKIIAEESSEESLSKENNECEHLWIIDPLDGTNNFAHSNPQFAVSIAYYNQGKAKYGVVYNPIRNEKYTAEKNKGAFLNSKNIKVSKAKSINECLVGTGFYYDRGSMMEDTLETLKILFKKEIHGLRRLGAASLDLCMVANGTFDAFFEYKLAPWDFAAGALILEEAGGKVSSCKGENLSSSYSSLLATNGNVHDEFIKIVSPLAPVN